jgi:hypothetical protein
MVHGLPERLGPWKRKADSNGKKRRGGLTAEEKAEKAEHEDARRRLDSAIDFAEELDEWLKRRDRDIEALQREVDRAHRLHVGSCERNSELSAELRELHRERDALQRVNPLRAQLVLLMGEELKELSVEPLTLGDVVIGTKFCFSNSCGIFELSFDLVVDACELKVIPSSSQKFTQPFTLKLTAGGLSASNIRELTGTFGLDGRYVPEAAKKDLFKPRTTFIVQPL